MLPISVAILAQGCSLTSKAFSSCAPSVSAPSVSAPPCSHMGRRPFWWDSTARLKCGDVVHVRWKAVVHDDGQATWDIENPIRTFLNNQKAKVSRELRDHKACLSAVLEAFSWNFLAEFPPSARQLRSGNSHAHEKSGDALSATTKGLLALFLLWSVHRRDEGQRSRATAVLYSALQRVLPQGFDMPATVAAAAGPMALQRCQEQVVDGACVHWRAVSSLMPKPTSPTLECTIKSLIACVGLITCPAVAAVSAKLLEVVSKCVDERLPEQGFQEDPYKACDFSQQSGKRRVIDQDYKHHVVADVLDQKLIVNGTALCKRDGVDGKSVRDWQEAELSARQVASFRLFQKFNGVLNLCEDGARLGNPAAETIVYLARQPSTNLAMWTPPQVHVGGTINVHEDAMH